MPTSKKNKFHNGDFDSWQTSVLIKLIEEKYGLDMESEEIINKIFGWHPLCENVIDREDSSKNLMFNLTFFELITFNKIKKHFSYKVNYF